MLLDWITLCSMKEVNEDKLNCVWHSPHTTMSPRWRGDSAPRESGESVAWSLTNLFRTYQFCSMYLLTVDRRHHQLLVTSQKLTKNRLVKILIDGDDQNVQIKLIVNIKPLTFSSVRSTSAADSTPESDEAIGVPPATFSVVVWRICVNAWVLKPSLSDAYAAAQLQQWPLCSLYSLVHFDR